MFRIFLTAAGLSLLVACGSSVKLDEVAVEDRSGTAVSAQAGAAATSATAGSGAGTAAISSGAIAPVTIAGANTTAAAAGAPSGVRVVYFDYDSFVIRTEFQAVIESHARYLKADTRRKVAIEGHTDETGGREYNLALGQKRSEAVRRALTLLGVADAQLEAVSFGKEKPAQAGTDEAALAKNRRAEISYR